MELTRVDEFNFGSGKGKWWAKRDDVANAVPGDNMQLYPAGSKVRQYARMAALAPGKPMIVGCSADSAMQIYVAAAAKLAGVEAIVYTAKRKVPTAATQYALEMGATVKFVGPGGYLNVIRAQAREHAKKLGVVVRWDERRALTDAMWQVPNVPWKKMRRVIVPTGSGLTCAGVMAGLANLGWRGTVFALAVSRMAVAAEIRNKAATLTSAKLPKLILRRHEEDYGTPVGAKLPDGTPLDPFYAAKALRSVRPGDLLWIPGVRPLAAWPKDLY